MSAQIEESRTAEERDADRRQDDANRRADLRWMADNGESAIGAARRLGLAHGSLAKWCAGQPGMSPVWSRMRSRDPLKVV